MKTIKIIEGKAFMCEELQVNPSATRPDCVIWYNLEDCIKAVRLRMSHCMGQLEEAIKLNTIYAIDECGIHHAKGTFVTRSYEAMESLMKKLQLCAVPEPVIDITWVEDNLSFREADQLFKAYVAATDHFGICEMRLFDAVITIRDKGVEDPNKTVLRTCRNPE